jgi:hypothetical protein
MNSNNMLIIIVVIIIVIVIYLLGIKNCCSGIKELFVVPTGVYEPPTSDQNLIDAGDLQTYWMLPSDQLAESGGAIQELEGIEPSANTYNYNPWLNTNSYL